MQALILSLLLLGVLLLSFSLYYFMKIFSIVKSRRVIFRWRILLVITCIFLLTYLYKMLESVIRILDFNDFVVSITYFCGAIFVLIVSSTVYTTFEILYEEMEKRTRLQKQKNDLNRRLTMIIKDYKMKSKKKKK